MNHKQKLGYTLLGAGIMAVGITIGQFITPDIEAQSNGVFDKITCREIEVVDTKGNKAIVSGSGGQAPFRENWVTIHYPQGDKAIQLLSNEPGTSMIKGSYHTRDAIGPTFELIHYASGDNKLILWNKVLGGTPNYPAIELECNKKENRVFVRDRRFEWDKSFRTRKNTDPGVAIGLHSHLWGNEIFVVNPYTGTTRTLEDR